MVKGSVEAYLLVMCSAFHFNARQPVVPMFTCPGAVEVEVISRGFGCQVLVGSFESCARQRCGYNELAVFLKAEVQCGCANDTLVAGQCYAVAMYGRNGV